MVAFDGYQARKVVNQEALVGELSHFSKGFHQELAGHSSWTAQGGQGFSVARSDQERLTTLDLYRIYLSWIGENMCAYINDSRVHLGMSQRI